MPYHDYNTCPAALGDMNGDGLWNVQDLVILARCVMTPNCEEIQYGCAGLISPDTGWSVLDIIYLAQCILNDNCCDLPGNSGCGADAASQHQAPSGMTEGEHNGILTAVLNAGNNPTNIVSILELDRSTAGTGRKRQSAVPRSAVPRSAMPKGGRANSNSRFSGRSQTNPKGKFKK